jgi:hypothetical protein
MGTTSVAIATRVDRLPAIADRRTGLRFSLRLPVKCRPIEPRSPPGQVIVGESLNVSSKGLLFSSATAFLPGQVVEAIIDWPIRLGNRVRLSLFVEGVVVRSVGNHTAIRIERHQFRTRSATEWWAGPKVRGST